MAGEGEEKMLIYAMVARGTTVVAEQTVYEGNFRDIAAQCLQRLPYARDDRFTYACDGHTFTFLVHQGYAFCVVATDAAGREVPLAFLEMIKEDFNKRYAGGKAATAAANSLSRDFGPRLKEQMQYCMDHPEELSRLSKVKAQVSEVKGIMMENIDKVIDRGEHIDGLVTRTEQLHEQAADFRQQGTRIRRKMWFQNMKVKLIVLGIVVALILIIVLSICHGKCH
ncbi:vesicle-associated membrane protein 721-like [Lolium rigidum]|uniref:vesicle-associated membrane protein 721-like n=1 Tax=Lolium rigidum TaxID=89674 RepID=UPI001F5D79AF|nr:vesicle-associated membrane protein 721-like [Lolium rigidum]